MTVGGVIVAVVGLCGVNIIALILVIYVEEVLRGRGGESDD